MGVKGLQSFSERHSGSVSRTVSIEELAKNYMRQTPGVSQPILVVDGMSLINGLLQGKIDWLYGGQWREYHAAWENFILKFSAIGIKLVVFFDGCVVPMKRSEWVTRRLNKMKEIDEMFWHLKRIKQHPPDKEFKMPAAMGLLSRFVVKFLGVEVYSTINEADAEIAEYANSNESVFAILAQDSDYMIYDTKDYLSSKHLDLQNMTTLLYDRKALADELGLELHHLPLFSSLAGNDVVPVELMKPLHYALCNSKGVRGSPSHVVMPLLAKLITKHRWTGNYSDRRELEQISLELFGHIRNSKLISEGLKWYKLKLDFNPFKYGDIVERKHILTQNLPNVFTVFHCSEYESSEVMEDSSDRTIPPVALIYQKIRRRGYFILFRGRTDVTVNEWLAYSHSEKFRRFEPYSVHPIPFRVPGGIPRLEDLWNEAPHLRTDKLKCFLACLGISLTERHLCNIPPKFVILSCVLNFLLLERPGMLKIWEVTAYVVQAVLLQNMSLDDLRSLPDQIVDTHAVHLAVVFMRGVAILGTLLGICGYPFPLQDCMPWHFFDGKLFHDVYNRAKSADIGQLCSNQSEEFQVHQILTIVTFGTSFQDQSQQEGERQVPPHYQKGNNLFR